MICNALTCFWNNLSFHISNVSRLRTVKIAVYYAFLIITLKWKWWVNDLDLAFF